jgi:hypothetical protein
MAKNIVTVGLEIPGQSGKYLPLSSDQSLLDYDVIVFVPDISDFITYSGEFYQGKSCLSDNASFILKEKSLRWKQELLTAFQHGKTVFIYMSELKEVFVATGTFNYSGTGRNRVTTRHVNAFDNFKLRPLTLDNVTAARGREMKAIKELGVLAPYWAEFGKRSQYEVYFDSKVVTPLIVTKTGDKTVVGVVRPKPGSAGGAIVLLPPVQYEDDTFVEEKNGKTYWTKSAIAFGKKWISALLEIDSTIAAEFQRTPQPNWVKANTYALQKEGKIQENIESLSARIVSLEAEKQTLVDQLRNEGSLRNLLYESGPLLEAAILEALQILGINAEGFRDSSSEFDVVFTWKGTRFLGEAEGKDNKPINVDKISQLERNLSEDFARDEVTAYPRAILFGNAFRLQELSVRKDFFTEKCVSTAERIKAALVRTPDLFFAARYVKESGDTEFANACIEALVEAKGTVVEFPMVPKIDEFTGTSQAEKQPAT